MSEILSGRNPILEALKSGRPINRILISKTVSRHSIVGEIINLAKRNRITVEYVENSAIERVIPVGSQGLLAYASAKDYISLNELTAISRVKNEPPFYIVLDGIEDPHNFGAILRTADATGVHGVIIRQRREVGLTAAVAKASAGAIEYIPVTRVPNIAQTIELLKKQNVWVIGVDMNADNDYRQVDYNIPAAIVIGGEGSGLSELVRKRCDMIVSIPMKGKISSLNASVATALVLYEVFYQRNKRNSK
ncbi:MAG: 23S rRNA (guanosine(2251)-2'-O)-methyltransferase RlmB [Dehalococcoidales bacterium]|nr:23S rRNA (guanosine(2251)-2'-O)-methyltransferase RlmB [Dehalococcoidales bacterium]